MRREQRSATSSSSEELQRGLQGGWTVRSSFKAWQARDTSELPSLFAFHYAIEGRVEKMVLYAAITAYGLGMMRPTGARVTTEDVLTRICYPLLLGMIKDIAKKQVLRSCVGVAVSRIVLPRDSVSFVVCTVAFLFHVYMTIAMVVLLLSAPAR